MKVIVVAVLAIVSVAVAVLGLRFAWAALFGGIRDDISDGPARRDERGRGGQ